jgi:hypothetical protein
MPLELWILLALGVVGVAVAIVNRLRRTRRETADGKTNNIYPLW